MGRFLTGKARIEQTSKRRIWKLLENILYEDDDGSIIICPRNMYSDGYTIPLVVDVLIGAGFDFDTRCSAVHDQACYNHEIPVLKIGLNELIEFEHLIFDEARNCYVCKDIPPLYIEKVKITKLQANSLLYRCMEAANVPFISRVLIRLGVCFNIGWLIDLLTNKVFDLNLEKMYSDEYWNEHVEGK